jgi:hypothetical protein
MIKHCPVTSSRDTVQENIVTVFAASSFSEKINMNDEYCGKVFVRDNKNPGVLTELNVRTDSISESFYKPKFVVTTLRLQSSDFKLREYNAAGRLLSLFDCCLNFVTVHLDLVDSFEGFPEDVAAHIWQRGLDNATCELNVSAFCQAFPDVFLPKCKIDSALLLDTYDALFPQLLANVVELDLSDCKLGDDHEIIAALHEFASLRVLSLKSNALGAAGFRNLVSPTLVKKRAFKKLDYLDLRDNDTDRKSFRRVLSALAGLRRIVVSCEEIELEVICETMGEFDFCKMTRPHMVKVETSGWAGALIDSWSERLAEKMRLKRKRKRENGRAEEASFYGGTRKKRDHATQQPQETTKQVRKVVFMFHKSSSISSKLAAKPSTVERLDENVHNSLNVDILNMYK